MSIKMQEPTSETIKILTAFFLVLLDTIFWSLCLRLWVTPFSLVFILHFYSKRVHLNNEPPRDRARKDASFQHYFLPFNEKGELKVIVSMSEIIYQSWLQWLQRQKKLKPKFSVSSAAFRLETVSLNQISFLKFPTVSKDSAAQAFSGKHGAKWAAQKWQRTEAPRGQVLQTSDSVSSW